MSREIEKRETKWRHNKWILSGSQHTHFASGILFSYDTFKPISILKRCFFCVFNLTIKRKWKSLFLLLQFNPSINSLIINFWRNCAASILVVIYFFFGKGKSCGMTFGKSWSPLLLQHNLKLIMKECLWDSKWTCPRLYIYSFHKSQCFSCVHYCTSKKGTLPAGTTYSFSPPLYLFFIFTTFLILTFVGYFWTNLPLIWEMSIFLLLRFSSPHNGRYEKLLYELIRIIMDIYYILIKEHAWRFGN